MWKVKTNQKIQRKKWKYFIIIIRLETNRSGLNYSLTQKISENSVMALNALWVSQYFFRRLYPYTIKSLTFKGVICSVKFYFDFGDFR